MKLNLENKYDILYVNGEVKNVTLKDILWDDKTIFYFYPKDKTLWYTLENKFFTSLKDDFWKLWIELVWVSKDSIESHRKFIEKQGLQNDLISDPDLILQKELWVYWEKNNYWKIVMGIISSTFLVDKDGEVLNEWRNIRATWHAERILKGLSK